MRIQAVEFSRVCVSSSFSNLLFFDFWCNFIAPCARLGQLFGGFCLAGRVLGGGGGGQSLQLAAGVEHPYLGCTLVEASGLVAMCKTKRSSERQPTEYFLRETSSK